MPSDVNFGLREENAWLAKILVVRFAFCFFPCILWPDALYKIKINDEWLDRTGGRYHGMAARLLLRVP
jgi:hypothetical protein